MDLPDRRVRCKKRSFGLKYQTGNLVGGKNSSMQNFLNGSWLTVLVRGLIAMAFGLFAMANATATALILFAVFVLYAVTDGVFTLVMAIIHRRDSPRWWLGGLYGLMSTLFGLFILISPKITALLMLYTIAARAIIGGFFEVGLALNLGKQVKGEWLMIVAGLLSIFFGAWMFLQPLIGGLAIMWVIGLYAFLVGTLLVFHAVRIKMTG